MANYCDPSSEYNITIGSLPRGSYVNNQYGLLAGQNVYAQRYYVPYQNCLYAPVYGFNYQYGIAVNCCCDVCGLRVYAEHIENSDTVDFHLYDDLPCCWQPLAWEQITPEGECTGSATVRYILEGCVRPPSYPTIEDCEEWLASIPPLVFPGFGIAGDGFPGSWLTFCSPFDTPEGITYTPEGCKITVGYFNDPADCSRRCVEYTADVDVNGLLFWRREWAHCDLIEGDSEYGKPDYAPTFLGERVVTCEPGFS